MKFAFFLNHPLLNSLSRAFKSEVNQGLGESDRRPAFFEDATEVFLVRTYSCYEGKEFLSKYRDSLFPPLVGDEASIPSYSVL